MTALFKNQQQENLPARDRRDWNEIESLGELHRLIASDGYAASFQDLGQYRSALVRHMGNVLRKLAACQSTVRAWRERMGKPANWPLHAPTDVERAMVAEIAELRAQQAAAPGALELLNVDELVALRRFVETCQDGEGYDVPKMMMQRLAAIGAVRRTSGSYYETTDFGVSVLHHSAPGTPEAPADLPRLYRFDCYVGKTKMAAGGGVHASTMEEAEQKARKLIDKEETIKFESNQPCHPTRKCSICANYERAAQLDGVQGEKP